MLFLAMIVRIRRMAVVVLTRWLAVAALPGAGRMSIKSSTFLSNQNTVCRPAFPVDPPIGKQRGTFGFGTDSAKWFGVQP
jgi:hypothetical protein